MNRDGFAANDQEVPLGRVQAFIQINAKSEHYIVGVDRFTVRETQPLPQPQRILKAVRRDLPGLCKGRLRKLRRAVDMNEVRLHGADDFPRRRVQGEYWVQHFRFGAQ